MKRPAARQAKTKPDRDDRIARRGNRRLNNSQTASRLRFGEAERSLVAGLNGAAIEIATGGTGLGMAASVGGCALDRAFTNRLASREVAVRAKCWGFCGLRTCPVWRPMRHASSCGSSSLGGCAGCRALSASGNGRASHRRAGSAIQRPQCPHSSHGAAEVGPMPTPMPPMPIRGTGLPGDVEKACKHWLFHPSKPYDPYDP